jgi:hypothetical protein
MRREMVDIVGREPGAKGLEHLAAFLEAEPEQEGAADGLVVSIGLTNQGNDEIPLINPFALVQFLARNETGFPLRIPTRPPELLIHRAGGERWTIDDGPSPVVSARKNDQALDPSSLNTRIIPIGAGDEYHVSYAIDRLLEATNGADEADGAAATHEVPIADGTYRVRCIATLIHGEQTGASRIVQPEEIAIRFVRRA